MNSSVVDFMNGTTHTSERALHGYFSFHRLFLWALQTYPSLANAVEGTVLNFIRDPQARLKKNTPNVGEWLGKGPELLSFPILQKLIANLKRMGLILSSFTTFVKLVCSLGLCSSAYSLT